MEKQSVHSGTRIGALAGMGAAVVFLAVVGYLLVRPGDSSYRALVAVWLWALPALAIFGSVGSLAGKGVEAAATALNRAGQPQRAAAAGARRVPSRRPAGAARERSGRPSFIPRVASSDVVGFAAPETHAREPERAISAPPPKPERGPGGEASHAE